ncbi:MAG: hypothetical protein V5A23_03515 [Halobacteriales archaeon]
MAIEDDGFRGESGDDGADEPISEFHARARELMQEDREVLDALDE